MDDRTCPAGCGAEVTPTAWACIECQRRLPGQLRADLEQAIRRGGVAGRQGAVATGLAWLDAHPPGPRVELMRLDAEYKRRNFQPAYETTFRDGRVRFFGGHVEPDLTSAVRHLSGLLAAGGRS